MKRILIIETEYTGHYLPGYILYVLRSFKNQDIHITLVTSIEATKKAKEAIEILRKENVPFNIDVIKNINAKNYSSINLFMAQVKFFFEIKKKFKSLNSYSKIDHVFLASIQKFDKAMAIFGSPFCNTFFSGIFLGAKFHLKSFEIHQVSRYNYLSKFFFKQLLKISKLTKIITNDHLLKKYIISKKWKNSEKLIFLHDPKEFNYNSNKLSSRNKLKLPKKSILILVYGALIDSKGIIELLSIFSNGKLQKDIRVILAGKQLGNIKNYLAKNNFVQKLKSNKKIYIFDNWINEEMESHLFTASDIVWIGYKNYSSPSGVLYQAVHKCLLILISNNGLINHLNKEIKIACPVNICDSLSIIKGINFVLDTKNRKKFIKNINKFSKTADCKKWVSNFKRAHSKLYF